MKIKSILVSQPKPADISKTPFADMMKKYGVNFSQGNALRCSRNVEILLHQ